MSKFENMVEHPALKLFGVSVKPAKKGKAWTKWAAAVHANEFQEVASYWLEKDTEYEWQFAKLMKLPEVKKLKAKVRALENALKQNRPQTQTPTRKQTQEEAQTQNEQEQQNEQEETK